MRAVNVICSWNVITKSSSLIALAENCSPGIHAGMCGLVAGSCCLRKISLNKFNSQAHLLFMCSVATGLLDLGRVHTSAYPMEHWNLCFIVFSSGI